MSHKFQCCKLGTDPSFSFPAFLIIPLLAPFGVIRWYTLGMGYLMRRISPPLKVVECVIKEIIASIATKGSVSQSLSVRRRKELELEVAIENRPSHDR